MQRLAAIVVLLVLAGCVEVDDFHCTDDTQCARDSVPGICEPGGVCSFGDATCAGGRRLRDHIGALSGQCAPPDISTSSSIHVDLAQADDVITGCGTGRDVLFQLRSPGDQIVYFDTAGSDFDATLSLLPGACADTAASLDCVSMPACGGHVTQLLESVHAGLYCLVVSQTAAAAQATFGSLNLRSFPAGRLGMPIGMGPTQLTGSTCGSGDHGQPTCGAPPGEDAAWFFTVCAMPLSVNVSSPSGAIVSLRASTPAMPPDLGCGASFNTAASGPGVFWLTVEAGSPCSGYNVSVTLGP